MVYYCFTHNIFKKQLLYSATHNEYRMWLPVVFPDWLIHWSICCVVFASPNFDEKNELTLRSLANIDIHYWSMISFYCWWWLTNTSIIKNILEHLVVIFNHDFVAALKKSQIRIRRILGIRIRISAETSQSESAGCSDVSQWLKHIAEVKYLWVYEYDHFNPKWENSMIWYPLVI